ncbi:MAG: NAD-dependent epimerase/dehydratase family protein [Candidatus Dormibacteraeota bacterium]|nr:NAD-dependent epimerase/dehydratase family protein [Candidatus Dormibacteraeota bacterium]
MKALVTGGAGFIGSNLTDALLRAGHDVVVVDDLSRGKREQVNEAAQLVVLDITDAGLAGVVAEAQPEIVFHQAAQIDVRQSVRDPVRDTRVNVGGSVNVLAASAAAGVRRVVFASTGGAIYGDTDVIPTPETQPCAPESPYGASKLCVEAYGATFQRIHGMEFIALRYGNVYGPRQDPHGEAGVVAIFAKRLLSGEVAVINGDGGQTRDYVYVDDVVAANLRSIDAASSYVLNIGTGIETDVNEVFRRLRALASSDVEERHGPAKPGEQRRSCLDISHARDTLGWQPRTNLDSGLARTLDFFRNV